MTRITVWTLGSLIGGGLLSANDMSPRTRSTVIAGLPDFHGEPFPEVVATRSSPPPRPAADADVVELAPVTVDTTKLPTIGIPAPPKNRNLIERLIPGTGVTVTDTRYGRKTVGRILFVPVFFDLNW